MTILVKYGHTAPFGLLYSKNTSSDMPAFLEAIKAEHQFAAAALV